MKKNYRWGIMGAGKIADKFCTALMATEGLTLKFLPDGVDRVAEVAWLT